MDIIWIILLAIAVIYILQQKKQQKTEDTATPIQERVYPYAKKMLLTKAEYSFYKIICYSYDAITQFQFIFK